MRRAAASLEADLEILFDGGTRQRAARWLGAGLRVAHGGRRAGASASELVAEAFSQGAREVLLVDGSCRDLHLGTVREACERLGQKQLVLGPMESGACYLVGCAAPLPAGFDGWMWRTDQAWNEGCALAKRERLRVRRLAKLKTGPSRLPVAESPSPAGRISVVIPARNAAASIERVVAQARLGADEVVVIDAGSEDDTVARARQAGARVMQAPSGRAAQMNAGAAEASGDILLFAHGDTVLPGNFGRRVRKALSDPGMAGGAFGWRSDRRGWRMRWVERVLNARARWFRAPRGDQALFMRRDLFFALGGFDLQCEREGRDLARRLRRYGRLWIDRECVTVL